MKLQKSAAVAAGAIMAIGLATPAVADAEAKGYAANSPGLLSGNVVQVPIHAQINACGNTVNILGALNPAAGNVCINK
ncbi:chaplin [Streptomyces ossamyceticus]|nr:chaplin [Streptomyces ossamyceticus]